QIKTVTVVCTYYASTSLEIRCTYDSGFMHLFVMLEISHYEVTFQKSTEID
ncbi:hypothetical protein L9F63_018631, partial [Diploptera punctata]